MRLSEVPTRQKLTIGVLAVLIVLVLNAMVNNITW